RAVTVLERLRLVADRARAAVERIVSSRAWDRDLEPIPQDRDSAEHRVRKHCDMRSSPFPLRHIRAVVAAQPDESRFEGFGETRPAALLAGTLRVVAPVLPFGHHRP